MILQLYIQAHFNVLSVPPSLFSIYLYVNPVSDVVVPVLQAYLSGNQAYTAVTSITMVRKDGQHVKVRMSMSMMWPDVKGVAPGNMIFIMPSSLSDFQSSPSAMDISEPTFGV